MDDMPSYDQLSQRVRALERVLAGCHADPSPENFAQNSETLCREMVRKFSELICRFSPEGTIMCINPAFSRHFGNPPEKLVGSSLYRLIPVEDHGVMHRYLGTLTAAHPIGSLEHRMIAAGGEYRWYQCNYCAIFDADGGLTEYQSVGRDVTDRKQAESDLQKSEAKYRSIMDAMQDAVYVCSPEKRIQYMNRAMIERIGRDATGEICHKVYYDKEANCPWCVFDRVVQGENVNHELENSTSGHYYSVSSAPINYSGDAVSKLTVFRDMTELKEVQEQLRQSEKMASLARLAGGHRPRFQQYPHGDQRLYRIAGGPGAGRQRSTGEP